MAVIRWDPFRDMNTLQDRMNNLFEEVNRGSGSDEPSTATWSPAVDIFETYDEIVVQVEVPGLLREDIELNLDNNVLSLKGNRKLDKESADENYHRIERSYGSFSRSFSIPTMIKEDDIKADYKDGVLSIALPKTERARPKEIKIRSE